MLATLFAIPAFAQQSASQIKGEYIETRSADVYTGQCFANGEMNLAGDEAILAWHVTEGKWDGADLSGLTVGAAVKAQATLGDPYAQAYPAKAVLFVEKSATPQQRQALINFAQEIGRGTAAPRCKSHGRSRSAWRFFNSTAGEHVYRLAILSPSKHAASAPKIIYAGMKPLSIRR